MVRLFKHYVPHAVLFLGLIDCVLLFVTGQWMRVIPTSWEVFPNALSAALQYVSLDWPTENGWVNYNGLQQLAYRVSDIDAVSALLRERGLRLLYDEPRRGTAGSRINFIHPKDAGGVLVELVEPAG